MRRGETFIFFETGAFSIGKSAFQREMDDVALLFRECSRDSLVLVDELGRGTSAREGAALGAAVVRECRARHFRTVATQTLILSLPICA